MFYTRTFVELCVSSSVLSPLTPVASETLIFYKLNVDLSFPVLSHLLTPVTFKILMFYKLPVDQDPVLSQLFTPITFDASPIGFRALVFYKFN